MTRRRIVTIAVAAVLAAAAGGFAAVAPQAQAVVKRPYDISWPQCPNGQPMPDPAGTSLVIIGLTKGRPFVENPCVSDQYTWARTNAIPAQAYTMLKPAQPADIAAYKAAGPWSAATTIGQLRNVGYAQGKASVATLTRLGWKPPVVWVDVEQTTQLQNLPWDRATTRAVADRNRAVIEGAIRGLEDSGYPVGIYSMKSFWTDIVGNWWLPAYPAWVSTPFSTTDAGAITACSQPSFSGGKVFLTQRTDNVYDFDTTCAAWTFTPAKPPAPSWGNDVNGDWKNDLLARQASTGQLWLYKGTGARTGTGVFQPRVATGTFAGYTLLDTVGDLTGDGRVDLVARDSAGTLWLFPGTGGTTWGARRSLGSGWNTMKAVTGIGDWTGDGKPDLVALRASDGGLYLYPGRGDGSLAPRTRILTGLGGMDRITGVGDMTLNGIPDLVTRESSTGRLWLYPGFANGAFSARISIGTGWNSMALIAGVGDFNADGVPDVMARQTPAAGGALFLYPGTSTGRLGTRLQVGTGWAGMNAIL